MSDYEMIERVRVWLGWPLEATERLNALAAHGLLAGEMEFPEGRALRDVMDRLIVPGHAADEIEAGLHQAKDQPEAWWLLERLYRQLTELDAEGIGPPWPAPVPADDPLSRYFHLYVFIAGVDNVLRLHGNRGIPEDVTWSTLGDVGLQVANYQRRTGRPGFDGAFWIWQHFRGTIFRLGRLQYNFVAVDFDPPGSLDARRSDPAVGIHIPAIGPLTVEACDESLRLATSFFARHFPEKECRLGTCNSWLLDEQLAEYLPEESNIITFQRRFTPVEDATLPGDEDVLRFVFGYLPESIDELPQSTTLERAIVNHLRDGRHWRIQLGWLEL